MIRQLLSLFLIAALLANQAVACCGHVHDGDALDHTSRVHVHLGGHSHCHGPAGHHHHGDHEHGPDDSQIPDQDNSLAIIPANSSDHDSDAIYVAEQEQVLAAFVKILVKKSPCFTTIPVSYNYEYHLSQTGLPECGQSGQSFAHALYLQTGRLLL